ncbi:hypothetical protein M9458_045357, partial [Cirrhinus mrigala]
HHSTRLKPRPPARPGTATRACGMSSEIPTGVALGTEAPEALEAPQAPGAARTSLRPLGAASSTNRHGATSRISRRRGAKGSLPSACSVRHISAGPSLHTNSHRRSTNRHRLTTSDASRHASCRTSFLHGITLNGRRIHRTGSTTHRETFLE